MGTIPDTLTTRPGHIAIDVRAAHSGHGIEHADVEIAAAGPHGRRLGPVRARDGGMDRQYYDARVRFPVTGPWTLRVRVDGAAGPGTAAVPLAVAPATIPWGLILRWLIPSALLLAAIGWSRRERRRAAAPARP